MNFFLRSALTMAQELRRRITGLTSLIASSGSVRKRRAFRLISSARHPHATMLELQARNREASAAMPVSSLLQNSSDARSGDRNPNLPVGTSIGQIRSGIGKSDGVATEAIGPRP